MSALPSIPVFTQSGGALIASPDGALRRALAHRLNGRCRAVQQVFGGADALARLEKGDWQVLFLDRRLPDLNPEELIAIIQRRFPTTQVVMLDSSESGATDAGIDERIIHNRVEERFNDQSGRDDLVGSSDLVSRLRLVGPGPNAQGTSETVGVSPLPGMIGTSEAMQRVYRMVRLVASRQTTVLITGQTGTGKELVARALHRLSPRSAKPLVVVNCAAIPEALLESELFGYSRGAFTGAVQSQLGRIQAAQGGTLFLDEVSELALGMQAKLLRFLEQKEIQRLGSTEQTRVDVRVVAASNVDLSVRAARNEFRQDLFYRLSVFPIELPPLAARRADIVPLAEHFLACMSAAMEMPTPRLQEDAIRILMENPWHGNVRELQHVMERASILAGDQGSITAEHLYFPYSANSYSADSKSPSPCAS